jgi:hypothetical protein
MSRPLLAAIVLAGSALALVVVLGLAALLGDHVRGAVLIADRNAPPAPALTYTDAPQSAAFFEARDSVTVRIPWDMTVSEFLSLYHLENNAAARAALARDLGASARDDLLREGDEVSFRLTARRANE